MKDNITLKEAIKLKIGDLVQFEVIHNASIPENKSIDTRVEIVTGEYQYYKKSGGWGVRLETLRITCYNFYRFKKIA